MTTPSSDVVDFRSANPHALETILAASETRTIIAARDIVDLKGVKLWARDQPVSRALQERLLDRGLKEPLETSLRAKDGLNHERLARELAARMNGPLAALLQPAAAALMAALPSVPLHPVAQLLLTAAQDARPVAFAHAVDAMAVAGAMALARRAPAVVVTGAMTAGLLHDIGEIYMSPDFGEADIGATLDADQYRQLVVHPHIGQLLLSQLTDTRPDVVRAVAEHHERLDGSGFPRCLQGTALSPLGCLVAAAEAALLALREPGASLQHASVALRVVPGEFDEHMVGPLVAAARRAAAGQPLPAPTRLRDDLTRLDLALQSALNHLDALAPDAEALGDGDTGQHAIVRATVLARHLLLRLRAGWNESGLWSPAALDGEAAAEAGAVQDALRWRLRAIERAARLAAGPVQGEAADTLDEVCAGLAGELG
ncbi:HD-GYP domain-containing protein [Aquabacterium sp. OR-4]|uniref:HD-GYP domain-containing protein n=1 Tax=Aquabacterium sp. OR-4 TaxID=2978127 RepID=UPI0021B20007|nr:HD domain-containing phosphohydrolase [Aquabacterium sp. OR-4]MDT7836875.1 HD domain-containing phosphohydrolase [Aquabacterium sp. OR-4]